MLAAEAHEKMSLLGVLAKYASMRTYGGSAKATTGFMVTLGRDMDSAHFPKITKGHLHSSFRGNTQFRPWLISQCICTCGTPIVSIFLAPTRPRYIIEIPV